MGSWVSLLRRMAGKVESDNCHSLKYGIFHEKQLKELCAVHAINNLLQKPAFTQKEFDDICKTLTPTSFIVFNSHRSVFGTGNYDVNVVMAALQRQDLRVIWFDKRSDVDNLNLNNIEGFIVNIPSEYKLSKFIPFNLNRRHWIAVKRVNGVYYNLDSKLKEPEELQSIGEFLKEQKDDSRRELLMVVTPKVEEESSWRVDYDGPS